MAYFEYLDMEDLQVSTNSEIDNFEKGNVILPKRQFQTFDPR